MPYSADEDLFDRLGEDQVRRLTDDEGLGGVDVEVLGRLRAQAGQYIDAYLRGRYDLPLEDAEGAPLPAPLLVEIEVSLLAAKLYSRRPNVETPEDISRNKKSALKDLGKIARGEIDLGVSEGGSGGGEGGAGSYRVRSENADLADQLDRY